MISFEKRKYKRIDTGIRLELYFDDTLFKADAINLSLSGIFCKAVARYNYLPDKILNFVLFIPKNKDYHLIKSHGLIVRETFSDGICYLAIYFNGLMNEQDKNIIKRYILGGESN
ncbi:MAG: PilZ domain-containing protein [Candidatus Kuenenia sp.]|nr:PilZ domain-containing protein [Candidatus Kuenenia hertensis]